MLLDKNLEMCDAVSIGLAAATTFLLGDQIDTTVVRDIGIGRPAYLVLQVETTFTVGNTIQFKLVSDNSAAIATDTTPSEHWVSDTFAAAAMIAGRTFVVPLPSGDALPYERYLGILQVNGATTAWTAGKINAFLSLDPTGYKSYADAQN